MSGYIGPLPVPQGIQRKQSFTATASQTTFNTNGYTDGDFINVYLNGVRLINGTDYTATNGSDIVLTTGASASDVLDFETFQTFQLVDQQFENVTLKNPTHEDTDGGRESAVSFKGEQSGGEISTLAQIQASHDGTSDDQKGDLIFKTNDGSDNDAPTERARFDSSGNLLISTLDSSLFNQSTETGLVYEADAALTVARSGGDPLALNRLSTDGGMVLLQKEGTTVGSIGVLNTNNLVVASTSADHAGVQFGTHSITPMEANADADNTIDLGSAAGRFKDLYLGGGAYIGGTGAANKLDDYEEGNWTPVVGGYDATTNGGHYTKVGNKVFIHADFVVNASASTTNTIGGLPFTTFGFHSAWYVGYTDSGAVGGYFDTNSTTMKSIVSGGTAPLTISAGERVIMAGIYTTTA